VRPLLLLNVWTPSEKLKETGVTLLSENCRFAANGELSVNEPVTKSGAVSAKTLKSTLSTLQEIFTE